jgi:hypothetical protein
MDITDWKAGNYCYASAKYLIKTTVIYNVLEGRPHAHWTYSSKGKNQDKNACLLVLLIGSNKILFRTDKFRQKLCKEMKKRTGEVAQVVACLPSKWGSEFKSQYHIGREGTRERERERERNENRSLCQCSRVKMDNLRSYEIKKSNCFWYSNWGNDSFLSL